MTDEQFEAVCDKVLDLIDADGASACIKDRTFSIDLHGEQVRKLYERLGPTFSPGDVGSVAEDTGG